MTNFTYTKDNGKVSNRNAIPVGFVFGERDKVLCVDLSDDFTQDNIDTLEQLRKDYIQAIYDAGFKTSIRLFFYDSITDVEMEEE